MDIELAWNMIKDRKIIDSNECWLYTGDVDPIIKYGRIMIDGERAHVHRISCAKHHGLNMNNELEFACHKVICKSRRCFNPDHVYKGNNMTNQRDVLNNTCPNGHDLGLYGRLNSKNKFKTKRFCRRCASLRQQRNKKAALAANRKAG